MHVKLSFPLWSFLFSCWCWWSSIALDATLISALAEGLATSLQSAFSSLESCHKVRSSRCWSSRWPLGLRVEPWSSCLYSKQGITHRMGLYGHLMPFSNRLRSLHLKGWFSSTQWQSVLCAWWRQKGHANCYLNQASACRGVLSSWKSTANCYSKEATWG